MEFLAIIEDLNDSKCISRVTKLNIALKIIFGKKTEKIEYAINTFLNTVSNLQIYPIAFLRYFGNFDRIVSSLLR